WLDTKQHECRRTTFELVLLVSLSYLILLAIMTTKTKNKARAANVPLSTKITVRIKPILAARSIGRFLGLSALRSSLRQQTPYRYSRTREGIPIINVGWRCHARNGRVKTPQLSGLKYPFGCLALESGQPDTSHCVILRHFSAN